MVRDRPICHSFVSGQERQSVTKAEAIEMRTCGYLDGIYPGREVRILPSSCSITNCSQQIPLQGRRTIRCFRWRRERATIHGITDIFVVAVLHWSAIISMIAATEGSKKLATSCLQRLSAIRSKRPRVRRYPGNFSWPARILSSGALSLHLPNLMNWASSGPTKRSLVDWSNLSVIWRISASNLVSRRWSATS